LHAVKEKNVKNDGSKTREKEDGSWKENPFADTGALVHVVRNSKSTEERLTSRKSESNLKPQIKMPD